MSPVNKEEAMHWLQKCKNLEKFNQDSESDSDENGTNEDTHSESSDSQDDQNNNEEVEEICGDNFAKQCDINTSDAR